MDPFDALDRSAAHVVALVSRIGPDQWGAATPCEQWDVTELVGHMIATMVVYRDLLDGASSDELFAAMRDQRAVAGDDPVEACRRAAAECNAAFRAHGALERTVHHPIGDITGAYLLGMRVSENVIHGLDLATAIGADVPMADALLETVYERMASIAGPEGVPGFFDPPRPSTPDAPLRDRLMALVGR